MAVRVCPREVEAEELPPSATAPHRPDPSDLIIPPLGCSRSHRSQQACLRGNCGQSLYGLQPSPTHSAHPGTSSRSTAQYHHAGQTCDLSSAPGRSVAAGSASQPSRVPRPWRRRVQHEARVGPPDPGYPPRAPAASPETPRTRSASPSAPCPGTTCTRPRLPPSPRTPGTARWPCTPRTPAPS